MQSELKNHLSFLYQTLKQKKPDQSPVEQKKADMEDVYYRIVKNFK